MRPPTPAQNLKERLARYTSQPRGLGALNVDQMGQIFRQVRKLIEREGLADIYQTAKFFGDWLQHSELNSAVALALIERLNRDIGEHGAIDLVVPAALGLSELRTDLLRIFSQYEVSDELLQTGSLWMRFGSLLLEEISGTPVSFPRDPGNKGKVIAARQRIWEASIAAYGDPGMGDPLWFDRLLIESGDADENFAWRLEFGFADGSRWGVRGPVYFTDTTPFRVNDINLNPAPTSAMRMFAAQRVIEARPADRLFLIENPNVPPAD